MLKLMMNRSVVIQHIPCQPEFSCLVSVFPSLEIRLSRIWNFFFLFCSKKVGSITITCFLCWQNLYWPIQYQFSVTAVYLQSFVKSLDNAFGPLITEHGLRFYQLNAYGVQAYSFLEKPVFKIFNEVQLIYSVLISTVQQSDSVIHTYTLFFILPIMVYPRILNVVPCAIQQTLLSVHSILCVIACIY